MRTTIIELSKEDMKFSSGHFTIFGEGEREDLHGHNFRVTAEFELEVRSNGMASDYGPLKKKIRTICDELDEKFIIAQNSKFLNIQISPASVQVKFGDEVMQFLPRDVLLLPIENATLEEFSRYIGESLTSNSTEVQELGLKSLVVKVSSGPGQNASHKLIF